MSLATALNTDGDSPGSMPQRLAGFTLIELLLALSLFALVSAMTYGGLRAVLEAREGTARQAVQLRDLQRAFSALQRDFEQAARRGIRDAYGDAQPAFSGSGAGASVLEFTRGGRPNPAGFSRSGLQRVAYVLKDETLVRLSWPVLDRGDDTEPYERELVGEVQELELRFLDAKGEWQVAWPPDPALNDTGEAVDPELRRPRAVEITLVVDGLGEVPRLFRVADNVED